MCDDWFKLKKIYEHFRKSYLRDAPQYQIVCFFFNIVQRGGGQTHVQKILLQILYYSGGYLAIYVDSHKKGLLGVELSEIGGKIVKK